MGSYINLIIQILLITILAVISFLLYKLSISLKNEKRITRFTIDALIDKPTSILDKIEKKYNLSIDSLSKILIKSKIMKKYSMKFEKYIDQTEKIRESTIDIISNKILIALIVGTTTIVSDVLRLKAITIYQLLASLALGYFIPNLFLIYIKNKRRKRMEEDLYKSVLIMNNAFKSGRSIMQAVQLVATELDGPISEEFKKMFIDLTYGLELEVVFNRFAERVKLEEVKYMASSLVILNKTGGNVVKVFSTIEKSFIERKKLDQELKSAVASSELVFRVLIALPILIVIVIYLFNHTYFSPLLTTGVGRIVLTLIILIYWLYILAVKKVTRLKGV